MAIVKILFSIEQDIESNDVAREISKTEGHPQIGLPLDVHHAFIGDPGDFAR